MDDEYDKLLDGLPTGASEEIAHKGNANSDLTANFKKDYMVGKIVG